MRVAVIGSNGQLGTDVFEAFTNAGHDVVGLTHADMDVRDASAVEHAFARVRPDLVVNTAAMHNVEACEADPSSALEINATGARILAEASRRHGSALMHVSTDYVFDGEKGTPYVETDQPRPLGVYGTTKLAGEQMIAEVLDAHYIVRTSGLYGHAPCRAKPRGNFVQLMLGLGRERGEVRVVTDEVVTPTYTADLAGQMVRIGESSRFGLYHATSQGETSWFDYAAAIFDLAGLTVTMTPAQSGDFPAKAPRPKYSVLDNSALRARGLDQMPHWRDSLAQYLQALQ